LCVVQRSGQPLFRDAQGGRESRQASVDASGASDEEVGRADDSRVFAAGAWPRRTKLWNVAREAATGTAASRDRHGGGSQ
jgi:hypothetical protein